MHQVAQAIAIALLLFLAILSLGQWWTIFYRRSRGLPWTVPRPRHGVPWSGGDVLVLILISLLLDGVVAQAVGLPADRSENLLSPMILAATSLSHLVWMAAAIVYLVFKSGALADDLGFEASHLRRDVWIGWRTFLVALVPVYGLQIVLVQWMPSEHPLVKLASDGNSFGILLLATVAAVVVAPLYEEFLFRVLLQGWLEKQEMFLRKRGRMHRWTSDFWPIVLTSVAFGALHFGHGPDPIALFVLALFLGYAYRQTHRIYAPLLVHAAVNSLAMLELWLAFWFGAQ